MECQTPEARLVRAGGFEPPVSCVRGTRFGQAKLCPDGAPYGFRSPLTRSTAEPPRQMRHGAIGVPAAIRTPTECLLRAIPLPVGVQARTPPRTCTAISGLKRSALCH